MKKDKDDYGQISTFHLQPLPDIHLYSHLSDELELNGSAVLVYALIVLACIIIIIAWVNYINLSTAMAEEKTKSIGIRKVVGASRTGLMAQVLTESAVFNILAVAIALMLVHFLFLSFQMLLEFRWIILRLYNLRIFIGLVAFIIFSTLIAGSYPAIIISALNPVRSIGNRANLGNSFTFRKVLVVFQFFAATVLMI